MDHLLSVKPITDAMAEDAIAKATRGNFAYVQTEVGELVVSYRKSAHLPEGNRIATVAFKSLPHALLGVALVDASDVALQREYIECPFENASDEFRAGWDAFQKGHAVSDWPYAYEVGDLRNYRWRNGWRASRLRRQQEEATIILIDSTF